jgi:potassium-transporting ATPase KdpC subunit
MLSQLRPALVMLVLMTLLTGLAYPLAVTGLGQLLFPREASGSLIVDNGVVIGSKLIGQSFTGDAYFHGRPSVTTGTDASGKSVSDPYNAAASLASNLGPTSKVLIDRIRSDAAQLRNENNLPVPVDLVTSSGSGLDPDITPAAAFFQVPRIAKARGIPASDLEALVAKHTQGRTLGLLGEAHVNVLEINRALDGKSFD